MREERQREENEENDKTVAKWENKLNTDNLGGVLANNLIQGILLLYGQQYMGLSTIYPSFPVFSHNRRRFFLTVFSRYAKSKMRKTQGRFQVIAGLQSEGQPNNSRKCIVCLNHLFDKLKVQPMLWRVTVSWIMEYHVLDFCFYITRSCWAVLCCIIAYMLFTKL